MPVAMSMVALLEAEAFKEVPVKEDPEKAVAEPVRAIRANANFMVNLFLD